MPPRSSSKGKKPTAGHPKLPRRRKPRRRREGGWYAIGVVAERFSVHPQTLRIYEREGLLLPSRSQGNSRLYSEDDLETLEIILNLTRHLGVNLAGVEIILNMRRKMEEMQKEMESWMLRVQEEMRRSGPAERNPAALVRLKDLHRYTPAPPASGHGPANDDGKTS